MLKPPYIVLDDNRDGSGATLYTNPTHIITAQNPAEVPAALVQLQSAIDTGKHVAGYFAYELGALLEEKLAPCFRETSTPLLWFGVFDAPKAFTDWHTDKSFSLTHLTPAQNFADYKTAFDKAIRYINEGDMYQVNLTFPYTCDFSGDAFALYAHLRAQQHVAHGALIVTDEFQVLSLSPELFFEIKDGVITGKPMKGTAPRGTSEKADKTLAAELASHPKPRAENLMIVDLMRNDFGRIAQPGQVAVPELFKVETFETLHQMTSTVTAKLQKNISIEKLLCAIFPCGSITGAPKIRAMQIIHELEKTPRGVYTGAIGAFSKNHAIFNVAIRTLVLQNGKGILGVGGGIVADSNAADEYDEALLKSRFLNKSCYFDLFETMKWERGTGFYLLERHLQRLQTSAAHFGFTFDEAKIHAALAAQEKLFPASLMRYRLTLKRNGDLVHAASPLDDNNKDWRHVISNHVLASGNEFLYHKTTQRDLYETELARAQAHGADDVLFFNTRGELCESARANVFVELDGRLLTPALNCGLLPGTLRAEWLALNKATESVITAPMLKAAKAIYLGNSLRGLRLSKAL